MKKLLFTVIAFLFVATGFSQTKKPKIVVGIVIDQMRYDYLYCYWNKYSENGFKKLVNYGYNCKNTNYNYVPTYTGPGHASIYTGTTPSVHGIIANDWFDKNEHMMVYCVEDSLSRTLGSSSLAGKMSPRRLLTTTVGDEMKIASMQKSKVIGLALKDRGAILTAGHTANAAYWFDDLTGAFITSDYYMKDLPQWVKDFNAKKKAQEYLSQVWNTLLPMEKYTESISDDNPYEKPFRGETKPVFPHNLPEILKAYDNNYGIIKATPSGNTITKEFAIATIEGEQLGMDEYTDLISISFSSPDYIGHQFGPKSVEQEDCYIRLDKDIAEIISYLEKKFGKNNFVLFLTADHAAVDNPAYLNDLKIPSGYINPDSHLVQLNNFLLENFVVSDATERFVRSIVNEQVYFNYEMISKNKIDEEKLEQLTADFFLTVDGVANVLTGHQLRSQEYHSGVKKLIQNGYNDKRSGDVVINLQPAWVDFEKQGTTHGSPYSYDTHVPLIFYGAGIPKGSTTEYIPITDIAPTLCLMMNIPYPNGSTGKIIGGVVR
ncbi:MAG: alkaline phosphatase PafA [Bacteroidota bacterium]